MRNAARLSAMLTGFALMACPAAAASSTDADPLDQASRDGVRALFKQLIDAENRHDLNAVRPFCLGVPQHALRRQNRDSGRGQLGWFLGH
jgi:hypothetical protein